MHTKKITTCAILPNYNSSEFLAKSLDSLVNQSIPFDEIIVVDDASTDHSLAIIKVFQAQFPQIRLLQHQENIGVAGALNTGIAAATSDYILLTAADDWYNTDLVACVTRVLTDNPQIKLICGDADVRRYDALTKYQRTLPYPALTFIDAAHFQELSQQQFVCFNGSGGMFMHRETIIAAGGLNQSLRWHSDWLLYFLIAFKHGIYYLNQIFVHVNMRKKSYSEGKYIWRQQKQVLLALINSLTETHRTTYQYFKRAALLPCYSPRYIPFFLFNKKMRTYVSSKLFWRLSIHNRLVIRVARWSPYRWVLGVRKWLRA